MSTVVKQQQQPCHPAALSVRPGSHSIAKTSTKLTTRVVHVFAPEIIKTDIANFRDLVQRLTGKQSEAEMAAGRCPGGGGRSTGKAVEPTDVPAKACGQDPPKVEGENKNRSSACVCRRWMNVEEANTDGRFVGGMEDVDGFMQSLIQYPKIPWPDQQMLEADETKIGVDPS